MSLKDFLNSAYIPAGIPANFISLFSYRSLNFRKPQPGLPCCKPAMTDVLENTESRLWELLPDILNIPLAVSFQSLRIPAFEVTTIFVNITAASRLKAPPDRFCAEKLQHFSKYFRFRFFVGCKSLFQQFHSAVFLVSAYNQFYFPNIVSII